MSDQRHSVTMEDKQRYVALDLEYNQPSGTIIQVGVAVGTDLVRWRLTPRQRKQSSAQVSWQAPVGHKRTMRLLHQSVI